MGSLRARRGTQPCYIPPRYVVLQVGTSDGRIVLLGRPGVEATLRSPSRSPTQHLCFLPGTGALLRVTQVRLCSLLA